MPYGIAIMNEDTIARCHALSCHVWHYRFVHTNNELKHDFSGLFGEPAFSKSAYETNFLLHYVKELLKL